MFVSAAPSSGGGGILQWSTTIRVVRRLLALTGVALFLTACGGGSATGVVTGEIRFVGGITPRGGVGPKPGRVIVFTSSGRVVAHQRVAVANRLHYRFVLRPGDYQVNAGSLVGFRYPRNCRPQHARVRAGGTTEITVFEGCGIQ